MKDIYSSHINGSKITNRKASIEWCKKIILNIWYNTPIMIMAGVL